MNDSTIVAVVAIGAGTTVTLTNLLLNGDGVSVTALFAMIGTLVGFVFGQRTEPKNSNPA